MDQKPASLGLYTHQKCLSRMKARLLASALDIEIWKECHSSPNNKKKANNPQNIIFSRTRNEVTGKWTHLRSKEKGASKKRWDARLAHLDYILGNTQAWKKNLGTVAKCWVGANMRVWKPLELHGKVKLNDMLFPPDLTRYLKDWELGKKPEKASHVEVLRKGIEEAAAKKAQSCPYPSIPFFFFLPYRRTKSL